MTAEIAVMNKNGIALAADSAVTVAGRKVYNSANKLFTLSKHHPIGVLIYGSADMNGIPWELIIKEFREQLRKTEYDSIDEYGTHFQQFLRKPQWNITEQMQLRNAQLMLNSFSQFFHGLYVKNNDGKNPSKYEDVAFNKTCKDIESLLNLKGKQKKEGTYDLSPYNLNQQLNLIFQEGRINISQEYIEQMLKLFSKLLEEETSFFDNVSGIAIAGYGKKDIYPSIFSFETTGFVGNKLRLGTQQTARITEENNALVCPFAQREMSNLFMEGIHPNCKQFLLSQLKLLMDKLAEDVVKSVQPDDKGKQIQESFSMIYQDFVDNTNKFCLGNFTSPRLNSIANLSKKELGKMAESLVELHVLGKQVSLEVETVGGPVDVAVISKHDGFIWLKRKLYFKPELNPCFFDKYLK